MELRLLMLAARVLDPRLLGRRLRQLGMLLLGVGWLWVRSVQRSDEAAAIRDARGAQRRARIVDRDIRTEQAWMAEAASRPLR